MNDTQKDKLGIAVKGDSRTWYFNTWVDKQYLGEWIEDGLCIEEMGNIKIGKTLCGLTVKGNSKTWSFHVWVDEEYLDEWRADGIDIDPIVEVVYGEMIMLSSNIEREINKLLGRSR